MVNNTTNMRGDIMHITPFSSNKNPLFKPNLMKLSVHIKYYFICFNPLQYENYVIAL